MEIRKDQISTFIPFPVSTYFLYSRDFFLFPVSRNLPYSRDFSFSWFSKLLIAAVKMIHVLHKIWKVSRNRRNEKLP